MAEEKKGGVGGVIALAWIAGILLLVVAVPLGSTLRFRLEASERGARFELRWLLITVGMDTRARQFRLALLSWTVLRRDTTSDDAKPEKKEKADEKPKRERKKSRISPTRVLAERRAAMGLVRYLWRHLVWQRFRVRLRVATPDPALTGELYGYLSALIGSVAAYVPAGSIEVTPDFGREVPGAEVDLAFRLRVFVLAVLGWRALMIRRRLVRPM